MMKYLWPGLMIVVSIALISAITNNVLAQDAPKTPPAGDTADLNSESPTAPVNSATPTPTPAPNNGDQLLVEDKNNLDPRELTGDLPETPPAPVREVPEIGTEAVPSEAIVLDPETEKKHEAVPGEAIVLDPEAEKSEERIPSEVVITGTDPEKKEERVPSEVVVTPTPTPAPAPARPQVVMEPEEPTIIRNRPGPSLVRVPIPGGTDRMAEYHLTGEVQVREYTGNNDPGDSITLEK
jgi:hypothetical protein